MTGVGGAGGSAQAQRPQRPLCVGGGSRADTAAGTTGRAATASRTQSEGRSKGHTESFEIIQGPRVSSDYTGRYEVVWRETAVVCLKDTVLCIRCFL